MVGDDLRPTGIDHVKLRTVDRSSLQSDGAVKLLVRSGYWVCPHQFVIAKLIYQSLVQISYLIMQ